jgi:hypothetical protein
MATSNEFITTMASYYVAALQSGLPYNFAYDVALSNAASQYNFFCAPNTQELKLRLLLNPNGCTMTSPSVIVGEKNYPSSLTKMISLFGPQVVEERITDLFASCLDGTILNNGFDENAINAIIKKILRYITDGCMTVRLACDCDTPSQDACRVVSSLSVGKNVRYSRPDVGPIDDRLSIIRTRLEGFLEQQTGVPLDISYLSASEVQMVRDSFIETLNILFQNNQTAIDPNSQEAAAVIDDFFQNAVLPSDNSPTPESYGFQIEDFVVFMSLLNSNGQFPRLASVFSRMANRLNNAFGNGGSFSVQPNSFSINVDYSHNSIIFNSIVQFEANTKSCDPSRYPSFDKDTGITTTCECEPVEQQKECKTSFLANVVTSPMIYEIPYFYASGRAVAELPTPPDVQFIPFKDVDNSILINLNTMAGRFTTKFVAISQEDQAYIDRLASSRGVESDSLFDFEGDPDVQRYEAFRIDFHPETYTDFQQATLFTFEIHREGFRRTRNVSVFRDVDVNAYSNALSQEHSITPNKKYYYIFRTIDINNNISNPSKVFELEMINNGGAIFPVIRTVDFKKTKTTSDKIEMRRLLLLSPTSAQTDIYGVSAELVENNGFKSARDVIRNLKLASTLENPMWDKKFKLRFTSLDTGRMLDINITPTTTIHDPMDFCGAKIPSNNMMQGDTSTISDTTSVSRRPN